MQGTNTFVDVYYCWIWRNATGVSVIGNTWPRMSSPVVSSSRIEVLR